MADDDIRRQLMQARDALNGAINEASKGNLFNSGAYARNAHKILDDLFDGE